MTTYTATLLATLFLAAVATEGRYSWHKPESPLSTPKITYDYGCTECPQHFKLMGDECVRKVDFHRQGWSEKRFDFSGFSTEIDVHTDVKIKSQNHRWGKVDLDWEVKGQRYGFGAKNWTKVMPGQTKMIQNFIVMKSLKTQEYDLEARQHNAKTWATIRVKCKVPQEPSTCPPTPTCEVCETCPTLEPMTCPPVETCPVCPTSEPTTPAPTCPGPVCDSYIAVSPVSCANVQLQHGMWLGRQGPLDPLFDELWLGPIPEVAPVAFTQDGTTATMTGVVTNGTNFWKYEFDFSGLSNSGSPYFQDLLAGCEMPSTDDWQYYNQFNGTLTNLATGATHSLVTRSVHVPQFGTGASLFDTVYGISFWFQFENANIVGDINLSLKCVTN